MHVLPCLAAITAIGTSLLAQANCSAGASPALALATMNPFAGTSLYGHPGYPNPVPPTFPGFNFLMDLTPAADIDITSIDLDLYDSGGLVDLGNGNTVTSPDQVGATTPVVFYIIPGATYVGNEMTQASWGTLGTGTLTVAAAHLDSTIVFNPPIHLPAGLWGVALNVPPTVNGPNPGPLHPMLLPTTALPVPYANGSITVANLRFQREAWTNLLASPAHTQSLEFHYTAASGYANWTSFGTGCVQPNAPVLGLAARPVIGTNVDFQATNIQPGTVFSLWLIGFVPDAAGTNLAVYGLPGCNLYLQLGSAITTNLSTVTGGTASMQIPLPLDPTFAGIVLYGQAAPMTSGSNIGFYASNGVCAAFGLF